MRRGIALEKKTRLNGQPLRWPFLWQSREVQKTSSSFQKNKGNKMPEINAPFTNVTLQTFASEGDLALCNQKWEKLGPKFVNRLEKNGLLSFEIATIWNKDSKLMRFVIFRYKSSDAFKRCLPIWEEIEKAVFDGVLIKVTAYRGVTEEYWTASDA